MQLAPGRRLLFLEPVGPVSAFQTVAYLCAISNWQGTVIDLNGTCRHGRLVQGNVHAARIARENSATKRRDHGQESTDRGYLLRSIGVGSVYSLSMATARLGSGVPRHDT